MSSCVLQESDPLCRCCDVDGGWVNAQQDGATFLANSRGLIFTAVANFGGSKGSGFCSERSGYGIKDY